MSLVPTQTPISLPFRNGTTTRDPTTTGFARPSSTVYVKFWNSGRASATSTNLGGFSRTLERRGQIRAWHGRGAKARRVRQFDAAFGDRCAAKQIGRQERSPIEVSGIEKRSELRYRR